jgi:hypothetical protein
VAEFEDALLASADTGRVLLRVRNQRYSWFVLLHFE